MRVSPDAADPSALLASPHDHPRDQHRPTRDRHRLRPPAPHVRAGGRRGLLRGRGRAPSSSSPGSRWWPRTASATPSTRAGSRPGRSSSPSSTRRCCPCSPGCSSWSAGTRPAPLRIGTWVALAGQVALTVLELVAITAADSPVDTGRGAVVGGLYGVPMVLLGLGMVVAGVGALRAGLFEGAGALAAARARRSTCSWCCSPPCSDRWSPGGSRSACGCWASRPWAWPSGEQHAEAQLPCGGRPLTVAWRRCSPTNAPDPPAPRRSCSSTPASPTDGCGTPSGRP